MSIAHSRLTAQGQISVPAKVRKKLGIGPGSLLEWDEADDAVIVRRAGKFLSIDVHEALFGKEGPRPRQPASVKEGIRKFVRGKHARR